MRLWLEGDVGKCWMVLGVGAVLVWTGWVCDRILRRRLRRWGELDSEQEKTVGLDVFL